MEEKRPKRCGLWGCYLARGKRKNKHSMRAKLQYKYLFMYNTLGGLVSSSIGTGRGLVFELVSVSLVFVNTIFPIKPQKNIQKGKQGKKRNRPTVSEMADDPHHTPVDEEEEEEEHQKVDAKSDTNGNGTAQKVEPPKKRGRGRPPKNPAATTAAASGEKPAPKKRGRPPSANKVASTTTTTTATGDAKPAPKKRGRPPKNKTEGEVAAPKPKGPPKKRGRPPKKPKEEDAAEGGAKEKSND